MRFKVESDFVYLHGEKNELLDSIIEFCDVMLDVVFPNRIDEFKLEDDISLLDKVKADRNSLTSGMI